MKDKTQEECRRIKETRLDTETVMMMMKMMMKKKKKEELGEEVWYWRVTRGRWRRSVQEMDKV